MKTLNLSLCVVIVLSGCAPTRIVKPLHKDQQVLGFSIGGPLINYSGHNMPMPLSSLFYARGITDNTTAFGGAHLTSVLFGVFQADVGACTKLYYNDKLRFGITTSPILNVAVDKWENNLRAWPELDINTYWTSNSGKSMLYAGVSNWFELQKNRANQTLQPRHWFINPHLGFSYSAHRWSFIMETKYLAPAVRTQSNVVEYKGINGRGALGIYLAVNRMLK